MNISRKILKISVILFILNAPLAIFTKVGSFGDRLAGVIMGIASTLCFMAIMFDIFTKETKHGK